jgi:hypothetical protein
MSASACALRTPKARLAMKARILALVILLALAATLVAGFVALTPAKAAGTTTLTGTFTDGATYLIQVPANWNHTLLLYSHGYVTPGSHNPAQDVGDPVTGAALLAEGYALAGSSYSSEGWALQQAFADQINVLDTFASNVGTPTRTIAWGHSLGGIITAGLVQLNPGRFDGALPMCGVLAGGIGTWNNALNSAFAFQVLLGGGQPLQVVHIQHPFANFQESEILLNTAQATPQGRARLALVGALGDLPGWFDPLSAEPAPTDYAAQEQNQFLWAGQVDFAFQFLLRAELEARAGGNPSWTTGVNFRDLLAHSIDAQEVEALYQQAGLNLDADLATLNAATPISADPNAVAYLQNYITFNGGLGIPVLTMHTTGDGLVANQDEQAYASVVRSAGDNSLLRETFVHRAGHCTFTPAETVTALHTLVNRLNTGRWTDTTTPEVMNAEAAALGPGLNIFASGKTVVAMPPAFLDYQPTQFLRPFDSRDTGNGNSHGNA